MEENKEPDWSDLKFFSEIDKEDDDIFIDFSDCGIVTLYTDFINTYSDYFINKRYVRLGYSKNNNSIVFNFTKIYNLDVLPFIYVNSHMKFIKFDISQLLKNTNLFKIEDIQGKYKIKEESIGYEWFYFVIRLDEKIK